jgi:transcriptional regulator with XRE-family HTH domain
MTEKVLLKKIGSRIKQIRTDKGISQQQLAADLDYEKSNMSRLESGTLNPHIATLYKVARALGITLSELLNVE